VTRRRFADPAGRLLLAALLLAGLACLPLRREGTAPVYTYIAVVDITRSMTVEDYRADGRTPRSRLDFAKEALHRLVAELPCGSRFGLGVFTERSSALLFEPIETCAGFPAIAAALEHLDWRMAWAADSRIAAGLSGTLRTLGRYDAHLLFITDGQEAPPVNPRYRTSFEAERGRMPGVLIGAGGLAPAPIPRFDERGRRQGYVEADEVPQRSTFGLPELPPEAIEGYHARNAPFGDAPAGGTEHRSALREDYLKQLAGEAGLDYHRLETAEGLIRALTRPELGRPRAVAADLRGWPAALALAALAAAYLSDLFLLAIRRSKPHAHS
jgi:mxaL protein